jgi:HK97 family phage portal protein
MFQWLRNFGTRVAAASLAVRGLNLSQLREFVYGPPTISGVAMSEEIALGITAVWRAVDLKSSTVAGLGVEVFRQSPDHSVESQPQHWVSLLLADPNDDQNGYKFWCAFLLQLLLSGNAYAEIERDELERPIALHLVPWRNVTVMRLDDGSIVYRLKNEDVDIPAADMLHVMEISWNGLVGISPITANRETLGTSMAADRHAGSVFGNGAIPRGFLKVSDVPTPETKSAIREAWDAIYGGPANGNRFGILFAGTEWIQTNMSPEDAQLLASRAFQITEVSRIFGVPPNLLFSSEQGSYNANEEANLAFYELGLRNFIDRLEAELTFKLLTRAERLRGYSVRYRVHERFPRITSTTSNSWSNLVLKGVATQNEARCALGLNPKSGADVLLTPTNLQIQKDVEGNEKISAQLSATATSSSSSRELVRTS